MCKKSSLTAEELVLGSAHQQRWLGPQRKSSIGSGADCCGNAMAAHPVVTVAGEFLGCVGIQFEIKCEDKAPQSFAVHGFGLSPCNTDILGLFKGTNSGLKPLENGD